MMFFFMRTAQKTTTKSSKTMKKISILLLILISIGITASAQTTKSILKKYTNMHIGNPLVRNDDNKTLFVFDYHGNTCSDIRPIACSSTTIYYTDTTMSRLYKICDLPIGYRVNDVQFVSLRRNNLAETPIRFCVFCGTHTTDTGHYASLQWIPGLDSNGFVGFFYIDSIQSSPLGHVYIRHVEDCKGLYKMVAYTQTNGYYCNTCNNVFIDNAVLDIVGLPRDNLNRSTILARVRFFPECNGGIMWQNDVQMPSTSSTERLVDIIKEGSNIITASVTGGNNYSIRLRQYTPNNNFAILSHILNVHSISITGGVNPSNTNLTTYSQPVRLSTLGSNNSVITFRAQNIDNGYTYLNGLFSFRFNVQNNSVLDGYYIKRDDILKDVCSMPDTTATFILATVGSQYSDIYRVKWNDPTHPMYVLPCQHRMQSICRYKAGVNNRFWGIAMGGIYISANGFILASELGYHRYFAGPIADVCMNVNNANAFEASATISSSFNSHIATQDVFYNDIVNYPVAVIPIMNTYLNTTHICND